MREQRKRRRSLWIPFAIVSPILLSICYSLWTYALNIETAPGASTADSMPDTNYQFYLVLMWSLPITVGLLALVWKLRSSNSSENGRKVL